MEGSGFIKYPAGAGLVSGAVTPAGRLGTGSVARRVEDVIGERVSALNFGADPSVADNTFAFQKGIDYLANRIERGLAGGTLIVPSGYYRCKYLDGTSGLSTLTIPTDNIAIEGEGRSSMLVASAPTNRVGYMLTWLNSGNRGVGGGIRNLALSGNAQANWGVFLDSWGDWEIENVIAHDLFGGILDACNNQNSWGEHVSVRQVKYISSSQNLVQAGSINEYDSCLTQYGVRFRAGSVGSWSECSIRDLLVVGGWGSAAYLDGCLRFAVDQVAIGWSYGSRVTGDGSLKQGVQNAVTITNSVINSSTADTGQHVVDKIYLESHAGNETTANNIAVIIDTPAGQTGQNRFNRVSNVDVSYNAGVGIIKIANSTTTDGLTSNNTFIGNRRSINTTQVIVTSFVRDTFLFLSPSTGGLSQISDAGTNTWINGVAHRAWGATGPLNALSGGHGDIGHISVDTATGRVALWDRWQTPRLICPVPGLDVVAGYGYNRIQALAAPAAPSVNISASGSTTWTYYIVAKDANGRKSVPSAAGSTAVGPASLAGSNRNRLTWRPVPGAVKYDVLRGDTSHYVALDVIYCYYEDNAASTSAYTPAAANPSGMLVVDGHVTSSDGLTPTIAAGAAAGTGPTVSISGTDQAGVITVTTGTSPTTGTLATITFGETWLAAPKCPTIGAASANAGASGAYVDPSGVTTSQWVIKVDSALSASTTYKWSYRV